MQERYQLREDLPLSSEQRGALMMAYDALAIDARHDSRRFADRSEREVARMQAQRTRHLIAVFGERKQSEKSNG